MYKFGHRHIYANQWFSLSSFAVFLFLWCTVCGEWSYNIVKK
jgi:hypothetical protein